MLYGLYAGLALLTRPLSPSSIASARHCQESGIRNLLLFGFALCCASHRGWSPKCAKDTQTSLRSSVGRQCVVLSQRQSVSTWHRFATTRAVRLPPSPIASAAHDAIDLFLNRRDVAELQPIIP
ncbi:hypothetical protein V8C35DRAFT_290392 [Trichoderma chlorosporum]